MKVKNLKWIKHPISTSHHHAFGGTALLYEIHQPPTTSKLLARCYNFEGCRADTEHATLDEAKDACQRHFEETVMACLEGDSDKAT